MELIVCDNYEELSRAGADVIAGVISAQPDAAVVLPTGDTPMGIYKELGERAKRGEVDAAYLRVFQLDEYLGITSDDPRSFYRWLARSLLEPLGIPDANVVRLPGDAPDPLAACRAYDQQVDAVGGFDLAVLGLGLNGHLGFNEPPAHWTGSTRVVDLSEASIESNARYWAGKDVVPRQAVTAGMRHLLAAWRIMLIVSGAHKREILQQTLNGPVTPNVPSSYLQHASNVTVIADRDAWPLNNGQ